MRRSFLSIGEFINCTYFSFNEETEELEKVGTHFKAKQTSVADIVAFQTRKGASEKISNPIPGLESSTHSLELYTTSQLPFKKFDQIKVLVGNREFTYTVESTSRLMDSAYSIMNSRTGKVNFPTVLELR